VSWEPPICSKRALILVKINQECSDLLYQVFLSMYPNCMIGHIRFLTRTQTCEWFIHSHSCRFLQNDDLQKQVRIDEALFLQKMWYACDQHRYAIVTTWTTLECASTCMLLCLDGTKLGNRYGPGVSSQTWRWGRVHAAIEWDHYDKWVWLKVENMGKYNSA